jgi:ribosomal protein S18 acetylase RimI-like enzyme
VGESPGRSKCWREHKPTDDFIVEAIESNLADYWLAMGENPKGEIHDNDSVRWEYSGGPYFNRVVTAELDQSEAEQKIEEVVREFAARRAAITWLVGPSATPGDLGERLTQHGFNQYEVWKGMARDLTSLGSSPELSPDIHWVLVHDVASRKDWLHVISRSYDLPRSARELLYESVLAAEGSNPNSWLHNLAYLDGKPVAASTLFVSNETAGIYLVATLPEARGKGLGTAVTWRALVQARELGCMLAVLQSTEMAQGIYEKLGFRTYCDISVYRRPAPGAMWKRLARVGARWLRRHQKPGSQREFWGVKGKRDSSEPDESGQPVAM